MFAFRPVIFNGCYGKGLVSLLLLDQSGTVLGKVFPCTVVIQGTFPERLLLVGGT